MNSLAPSGVLLNKRGVSTSQKSKQSNKTKPNKIENYLVPLNTGELIELLWNASEGYAVNNCVLNQEIDSASEVLHWPKLK